MSFLTIPLEIFMQLVGTDTKKHTDGNRDLETESAQWADSVKILDF